MKAWGFNARIKIICNPKSFVRHTKGLFSDSPFGTWYSTWMYCMLVSMRLALLNSGSCLNLLHISTACSTMGNTSGWSSLGLKMRTYVYTSQKMRSSSAFLMIPLLLFFKVAPLRASSSNHWILIFFLGMKILPERLSRAWGRGGNGGRMMGPTRGGFIRGSSMVTSRKRKSGRKKPLFLEGGLLVECCTLLLFRHQYKTRAYAFINMQRYKIRITPWFQFRGHGLRCQQSIVL